MNRLLVLVIVTTVVPGLFAQPPTGSQAPQPQPETRPEAPATQPAQPDKAGLHPRVKLETTLGDIVLELNAEKAPISTYNFIRYVEEGFYHGTIFHRVIRDFMLQGGGYTPQMDLKRLELRPPIKNEWQNGLKNERGTIAMARLPDQPDSATSQFFINVVDNVAGTANDLDSPRDGAGYAVFGRVVEGMEVVDKIKDTPVEQHAKFPGGSVVPVTPVIIKSARLISPYTRPEPTMEEKAMQEVVRKVEQETGKQAHRGPAGLFYVVLAEGSGASPKVTDTVRIHYTGWLTDGTKFDSSVDRGQPAEFPLGSLIPGWRVGVPLMKVGEKRKLILPPHLGYGKAGAPGGRIPPDAILIFDIELLEIK